MNLRAAPSLLRGKQANTTTILPETLMSDFSVSSSGACLPTSLSCARRVKLNSQDSIANPISALRTSIHLVDVWEELVRRLGLVVVPRIGVLITQISVDPQQAPPRHILLTLFPQYSSSTGMPLVAKSYAKNAPTTAAQIQPALASAKPARQIVYPP